MDAIKQQQTDKYNPTDHFYVPEQVKISPYFEVRSP
jgi:hypothetical protein